MRFILQDFAATLVAVLLVAGIIALAALGLPIPAELGPPLGAATTWLFIRGAQAADVERIKNHINGISQPPPKG